MSWLSKILKKEKKVKEEKRIEEKTAPAKLSLAPVEEFKKAKTESLQVKKKFDQSAILAHHLTEKSSAGGGENSKYTFEIASGARKTTVKNAVEGRFGVQVRSINILNMPGKERKKGGQVGFKPGLKKAIVTLENGQSIEVT